MIVFSPVRSLSAFRFLIPTIAAIGLGLLTCWMTLTGYTASQSKQHHSAGAATGSSNAPSKQPQLNKDYGKLPLSFEVNRGQVDAKVKYFAHGPGYNILLTPTETTLVFRSPEKDSKEEPSEMISSDDLDGRRDHLRVLGMGEDPVKEKLAAVTMRLAGASLDRATIEGVDELEGKVNYFIGNDSSKWLTNIPTFSKVAYRGAYPGVDVIYYGNGQQLEYDFVVDPGTNPNIINLEFEGANNIQITREGDLLLETKAGSVRQQKAVVFQEKDGKRKPVQAQYVKKGRNQIGFRVSSYDKNRPLVIDPKLVYLSQVNGGGNSVAIAVDANGFAYIAGTISSATLGATNGVVQTTFNGGTDAFVTKLNQAGNQVLYSTFLGGAGFDEAYGITVDAQGNAYITGYGANGFPITGGSYQTTVRGTFDCVVTKLNPTGSALIFSTFYGGNQYDEGDGIALDGAGNVVVAGIALSTDLVTTPGAVQATSLGGYESFAIKLNSTGSSLQYATYLGGSGTEFSNGHIALDAAGNLYLAGQTSAFNFAQVNSIMGPGGMDRGLFKSTNTGLSWGLSRTGLDTSYIWSIAIDKNTPSIMYAGTAGGVSKSTNAGASWTATPVTSGDVQALAIDPSNSSIIYAGTLQGVYKSTNSGNSWTNVLFVSSVQCLAIDPTNPTVVLAGTNARLFRTANGGANWSQTSLPTTNVRGVTVDPTNFLNLYVATSNGVSKSTNAGTNWFPANTGLTNLDGRSIALTPGAPTTLYVGTASGIFKTTNSGSNWSAASSGLQVQYTDNVPRAQPIVALAIDPTNAATIYAAPNSGTTSGGAFPISTIFKSTDAGTNWSGVSDGFGSLNNGFASLAIDPINSANVFAGNIGDLDAYVLKLNPTGTSLIYSTYVSGNRGDVAAGVAIDPSNSAYLIGYTQSSNFTTSPGAFQTVVKGFSDAFVAKINPAGGSLAYSTLLGGALVDRSSGGIAVDNAGNAHVAGFTSSTDFPVTPGAFQSTIGNPGTAGGTDQFVAKVNSGGTALSYASYLGGGGNEQSSIFFGTYLALDPSGNAYVTGSTSTPQNFPSFDSPNGQGPTYVAKIEPNEVTYSITGRLTTAGNVPIAGGFVEAIRSGTTVRSAASDSQGYYSLISLPAGDYEITPSRFGTTGHYLWAPPTRTFSGLSSNQTANFTGTQVYDIFGAINHSVLPSTPIFDVTVTLSGAASATAVTDVNGNFRFEDLLPGNYTVTPSKAGFTFNPANRVFNNITSDQFASFTTASGSFFTVNGKAVNSSNVGISGTSVVMRVNPQIGAREANVLTDANGNFSFANLQAGGNYQFLATKALLTFTPQNQTFNNLSANQTFNFTAASVSSGLVGRIAYLVETNPTGIAVINADGSGDAILVNAGGQCSSESGPAWSPDGSKLLFSNCTAGDSNQDMFYINANGTGLTAIGSSTRHDLFGKWSPDATHVTYTYGECSGTDLIVPDVFSTDLAGSIRSKLTNNSVVDFTSDWSPNGSSIIFARAASFDCSAIETSAADLFVMDAVGGNERRLTNTPGGEFLPVYSPDGLRVAYSLSTESTDNIYVMNSDGTGQTKITPDSMHATGPTWSPDGTKIAFSGFTSGSADQIFVINTDGTGLVQITAGGVNRNFPSWQHSSISGSVTGNANGLPITMTLSGTLTRVTKTDAAGNYIFGNLTPGGNYTVTPVSTAFGFTPAKIDVSNLNGNQIANFAILPAVIPAPTPPLADDFAAGARDPAKWNLGTQTQPIGAFDTQVSAVQTSGQLVVTPLSQTAGLHYNGYVAVSSFDFNFSKATVEVVQATSGAAETIFALGSDLENYTRFVVSAGGGAAAPGKGRQPKLVSLPQLIFQVRIGGELTSISIPYDANAHRFMRFRHEPTTNSIVFETSPDNVNFTVRHSVVLQRSVAAMTAELSAGTSTATNPGTAIFDNFNLVTNTFQFQVTSSAINESANRAIITVTRSGDVSGPATVDFATFDDTARQRTRYVPAVGTLAFAAGQSSRTFSVLLPDNSLVEGSQTLTLRLIDSFGGGLNSPGRAVLTVDDNDSPPITTNPLDEAQFFVRQHYYDFLSRNPDPGGLSFWTNEITQCGSNQACINIKRIDVSNAFYFELEFQQTGSYVYRLYRVAYGNNQPFPNPRPDVSYPNEDKKLLSYTSFTTDRARVIGGAGLAQSQLNLANSFIKRPEFLATYPLSLDGPGFVDAVLNKIKTDIGVDLVSQRAGLISLFNSGGRGAVIYRLADDNLSTNPINNRAFIDAEYNRAFVVTQYFGYLRRNPDLGGFIFWLGQVNSGSLRDVDKQHAMVCSFVTSTEYQERFSLAVTHNNTECAH